MKITKKITSIVLALLLAISVFAVSASAVDVPEYASLTITKYDLDETADNATKIGNTNALTGYYTDDPYPDGDAKVVEGAEFTIYYQGPLGTTVPATPNTSTDQKASGRTDEYGKVTFNVGEGETLPTGLYYVVETSAPAKVTTFSAPFYVNLPMTYMNNGVEGEGDHIASTPDEGTAWITNVNVYPKNLTTLGGAKLTKTINNAPITANTTLVVPPKFKLVEYVDGSEVVIAHDIEAKAGYTAITKNTDERYSTVTIAQKDGVIAVDGLPVGNYAFIETNAAQITAGTDLPLDSAPRTFTITKGVNVDVSVADDETFGTITKVNGTADNGTYEFTVDNSTEPTVTKEVTKADGTKTTSDGGSFNIGDDVVWTITPVVPADIATYQKYTVTDTIDSRLDFAGTDAITVKLDGTEVTEGFAATYDEGTRLVTVNFTDRAALVGKTLTIELTTQINSSAVADAQIPNKATLTYRNSYQTEDKTDDSDEPYVYTGAFQIVKTDAANSETKLADVEFDLVDANDNPIYVSKTAEGVYVFDADGGSNKVVTNTNGNITVNGLAYGSYKLIETKTNNLYQLLTAPVDITVAAGTGNAAVEIRNVKQPDLPLTGGMGTILFTVAGLALIGGAAFFFFRSRKTKREEA